MSAPDSLIDSMSPEARAEYEARCARFGLSLEKFSAEATAKWPLEKLLRMYELVRDGNSALTAGRVVGVSRSAVIGKVLRLSRNGFVIRLHSNETDGGRRAGSAGRKASRGAFNRLPGSAPVTKPAQSKRAKANGSEQPSFDAEPFKSKYVEVVVPAKERRGVVDLTTSQCRWPIGDPRDAGFHFCNGSKCGGLPYCETHSLVAFPEINVRKLQQASESEAPKTINKIATPVPETA